MTKQRFSYSGLALISLVFVAVSGLNISNWQSVSAKYHPWIPRYGEAVNDAYSRYLRGVDRVWYLIGIVEKYYFDWDLISYSKPPSLASEMYNMNYIGLRKTIIFRYDPSISAQEAKTLKARPHVSGFIGRLYGFLCVILPQRLSNDKRIIVLRFEGRFEDVFFFVPMNEAPDRFRSLPV